MPVLVAAGEFYFDFIFYRLPHLPPLGEELVTKDFALALGGGVVTTALTVARLGRKVELVSILGDTPLDSFALAELKRRRVGSKYVKRQRRVMGGLTVSVSLPDDRYFLTCRGANDFLERYLLSRHVRRKLGRARHVHFGLTPRRWGPFLRLVRWLRQRGVTASWDLGWNPEAAAQLDFRRLCALLDIVFFNRDEALRYSGASNPEAALRRLAQPGQFGVIKLGPEGALAVGRDGSRKYVRDMKVLAMETTGAGDAFNGGFLHAWLDGADLADCLRAGNICGALSTTAPGGSTGTPTRTTLVRLLRRMQ